MIKEGMFVRCPIDREHPHNPRVFATGKVISVNLFNETAHIKFSDPFDQKKYFEYIPDEVQEVPLEALDHCHLFKNSMVKYGRKKAIVVEYKGKEDDFYEYYLQDSITKEYCLKKEKDLIASFIAGSANPIHQLKNTSFRILVGI